MSTVYKGALRSKRKNELFDIANALGMRVDDEMRREDVEQMVKTHLLDNRGALSKHSSWSGLYHSMDQSERRAGRNSSIAASPDSDDEDSKSPRKHTQKAKAIIANGLGTPLRKSTVAASNAATQAVEDASSYTSALQAKTRKSFESLSSAFKSGATDISSEVRGEIKDATSEVNTFWRKTKRSVNQSIRRAETQGKRVVTRSRNYLSDSTNLTALVLILEASILVSNVIPMTNIEVGHRTVSNFIKSGGKSASGVFPHFSLPIPNFWALLSYAFWRPIILWSFWTVAIPLFVAHVITFERKHEPSSITFNLTRLALLSALSKHAFSTSKAVPHLAGVVAGEVRQAGASWFGSVSSLAAARVNYDFVASFLNPETQMILTTLAVAFATYEAIAHRPRTSA